VHGVFYRLEDGLLHDLAVCVDSADKIDNLYRTLDAAR
jgi:hypothetical protein